MTSQTQLDAQVSAYLADGPSEFPSEWRDAIASEAEQTAQRRPSTDWRAIFDRRWPRLAIVVVLIGLLAALAVPLVGRLQVEPFPQPTTAPQVVPQPTTVALVAPSQPTILPWTPDALDEPYPVPLRPEPSGGADVKTKNHQGWIDASADGAPGHDPRVDLVNVEYFQRGTAQDLTVEVRRPDEVQVFFGPAQMLESPLPEPDVEWISYGIVFDRDGDGSPDGQVGLDNIPGGCARAWYTEPTTGATEFVLGSPGVRCSYDAAFGESQMPMAGGARRPARGYMTVSLGLAGSIDNGHGNFYVWAALIRDGQLVSVDYAPDVGWLGAP